MDILNQIVITFILVTMLLKLYLSYRQINNINYNISQVPSSFQNTILLTDHNKAAKYNIAKQKLETLETIFTSIVLLIFTLGGGIEYINKHIQLTQQLNQGVTIIVVYTLINTILMLPFSIYLTFVIEQKFGFNKITKKLFILDLIKGVVVSSIIGIPLLYLILYLMNFDNWWIFVWFVLVSFNLLLLFVYPTFIAPLFNKFTSLADETLNNKINNLLQKCGFKTKGIFVMDGSKRSSHGNAYFTGIGKSKRIVFFDTLLKQLNHNEIEAVLAHELGHFKKKHILKQMILSFIFTLATLFILSILAKKSWFYTMFGVSFITNYNALLLFTILSSIVGFLFTPFKSYLSRKNEFEADDFARQVCDKEHLVSGLVKLYRDNAATLTPDSLFAKFYYSHPPAAIRIKNLEQNL